ncbi:MAG: response regulator [Microcoleaceae cyanobacterium]
MKYSSYFLKYHRLPIYQKFLLSFLPLSLLLGLVLGTLHYANIHVKRTTLKINEKKTIQLKANEVVSDLEFVLSDLLFLSAEKKLIDNLESFNQNSLKNLKWKQELSQDYVAFSRYKKLYDQVRVLDLRGQEVIRINYNAGQPEIVKNEKLQNKANRYWFEGTLEQNKEQIFISPLDLNIENGTIEQPLKPMIRFGIPVFDLQGEKQGIVVLNYLAQKFIDNLEIENVNHQAKILMLNHQGFWLKGFKPEDEWGFMYPDRQDRTFQQRFPEEWQTINQADSGQFETKNGLFTFITIYPLKQAQFNNPNEALANQNQEISSEYAWNIVGYIPPTVLRDQYYNSLEMFLSLYLGLLVLVGVGSWLVAISQAHRQLADSNLQKTLADLTVIINNLIDGLLVVDQQGHITRFNPSFLQLFDLEQDQILNQDISSLGQSNLTQLIQQTQADSQAVVKTEFELSKGRIGLAIVTSILQKNHSNSQSESIGSLILIRDITNEKEIDRMKTDFIATVSHELRTPLTSVLGFASIIQEKLEENIFPLLPQEDRKTKKTIRRVRDNLNIIVSEAERLTSLINDVLDIAKMEAGKVEWNMQSISIQEVIDRALAATASLFETNQLELKREIESDLPEIIGDRNRLIQVVINLISNAVKFTEIGSITCRAEVDDHQIRVSIIDTGSGIAPQDQHYVFEKFKQVGETLTDKPKGTGLGLPICQQIIEYHGGLISLESTLGQGSNFSFTVPIPTKNHSLKENNILHADHLIDQIKDYSVPIPVSSSNEQFTILIVDDDPHIREFLKQFLEAENYQVKQAKNGIDAINQVKVVKPNLIILDVMMPQINGFEVAAVMKNNPETRDIPIIMLSIVEDRNQGYKLGIDRYLTKPIDTKGLIQTIKLLVSRGVSNKKVLVVDQDASAVMTVSQVLQAQGYNIVEASNGEECIEKAISTQPDMILVDSLLSQEHDLIQTLRFEKGLENVVFVLMGDEQNHNNDSAEK